ncbi:unnamed protein product [Effrenium voratum]|nr:unnamed protein product [Effrenium voratum]
MAMPSMHEAGLNSMSEAELRVTCERLERSCQDMRSLLNEFVEEQAMLRREQDKLHRRIEKAQKKSLEKVRQDNFIGSLIGDMELEVPVPVSNLLSSIFRAKEERKVAKRRRWTEALGQKPAVREMPQEEGPFSENTVQLSWACELQHGRLAQPELAGHGEEKLCRWVREVMSGDPVAEAELPDAMWAQLAKRAEGSPRPGFSRPSPGSSPAGPGMGFFEQNAFSPGGGVRPAARAVRPDMGPDAMQDGPEHSGAEDSSHFDTLVGLVSNVAGHQVAQQMERGFEAAQQLAQQARAASKRMDRGAAEAPAPPSFSRRLQEAGSVLNFFTDWAAPTTGAEAVPSREAPDTEKSRPPPVPLAPPRAADPEDEPPSPPPAPPSREAVLLALQEGEEELTDPVAEPCSVPYGLVAQVTSLGAGHVRLSWLFDWEAAPAETPEAQRGFEVLWSAEDSEDWQKRHFSRSPAALELPTGCRFRLQVKAVVSIGEGEPTWLSSPSAAVSADLRAPKEAAPSEPSSPEASSQASVKPKGRVAASFGDFLKRSAASTATAPAGGGSSSSSSSRPKVVMGGSAPLTTKAQADPLSAAAPRVVKAGPLDPATEKWEIAERLRLRSGHNGTRDSPEERPRSSSFDSEDESLAKLSQALSSLERTRTALEKRQLEAVASEGSHTLPERLAEASP